VGPLTPDIPRKKVPRRRIAELATRQYGVVARWQLTAIGVGVGAIEHLIATAYLHQVHRGVYAVGHRTLDLRGVWMAAVLACGARAVLSHRDAAELWGFYKTRRRAIDVTAPGRSRHRSERITVHRPRSLDPRDVAVRDGIAVTTVARTLLDLAEVVRPHQLRRAWEEAQRLDLLDLNAVIDIMNRSPGRRGLKPLRALVAEQLDAPATKEELEARFADVVREFGLPQPIYNASLLRYVVDALYPEAKLAIELDSFEFHGKSRAQHERDRVKQLHLQLAGYTVVRLTWRMLTDPARTAAQIQNLLSARQVASVAPT
jgi:Protein of unknown function (DUF559)